MRVGLDALNARPPNEIVALVRIREQILLGHEEPKTGQTAEEQERSRQPQGRNAVGPHGDGLMVFIERAESQHRGE